MMPEKMVFMGPHEIRARLGVSRQRVYQITTRPDFPKEIADLAQGKVWLASDVEAWFVARRGGMIALQCPATKIPQCSHPAGHAAREGRHASNANGAGALPADKDAGHEPDDAGQP